MRYNLWSYLITPRHKSTSLLVSLLIIIVALPLISNLYQSKKASADGRKLIWKISSKLFYDNPAGIGYGKFQQIYNLKQADYLQFEDPIPQEIANAGVVFSSYNEYLQNFVEGGALGGILFVFFIFSLLIFPFLVKKKFIAENHRDVWITAFVGIVSFSTMSFVNFTVTATPVMCMFTLYLSIFIYTSKYPITFFTIRFKRFQTNTMRVIFALFLLCTSMALLRQEIAKTWADHQNLRAKILAKKGRVNEALKILHGLENVLSDYDDYWANYGHTLILAYQYRAAITKLGVAEKLSSSRELYTELGYCYQKVGLNKLSIDQYVTATYLEPTRFAPKIDLMNAYLNSGADSNAISVAKSILYLNPKIPSKEARRYKVLAFNLLRKFEIHLNTVPKRNYFNPDKKN